MFNSLKAIKSSKINEMNIEELQKRFDRVIEGCYDSVNNEINISTPVDEVAIYHELGHVTAYYYREYDNKIIPNHGISVSKKFIPTNIIAPINTALTIKIKKLCVT